MCLLFVFDPCLGGDGGIRTHEALSSYGLANRSDKPLLDVSKMGSLYQAKHRITFKMVKYIGSESGQDGNALVLKTNERKL